MGIRVYPRCQVEALIIFMDSDIDNLISELTSDSNYEPTPKPQLPSTELRNDNVLEVLNQNLASTLDNLNSVITDFKDRIEEGDTYESTVMGFNGAVTNINSTLNTLQKPLLQAIKHEQTKELEAIKHNNKKELEEIKAKNKATSGSNNTFTQNNIVWQGSGGVDVLKEFEKQGISLEDLEVKKNDIDVVDV